MFTPVIRSLALATPTVKFFSIDVDECDALTLRFGVRSLPAVRFVRAGCTPQDVVATVDANEGFLHSFYTSLDTVSTPEEQLRLQQSRSPDSNLKPPSEVWQSSLCVLSDLAFDDSVLIVAAGGGSAGGVCG